MAGLEIENDEEELGLSYSHLNRQAQVEIPADIDWSSVAPTKTYAELFDCRYDVGLTEDER